MSDFVELLVLKQRDGRVGENPGHFKMVLFLDVLPRFWLCKTHFHCRLTPEKCVWEKCVSLLMGCVQSLVASSLLFCLSIWTALVSSALSNGCFVWKWSLVSGWVNWRQRLEEAIISNCDAFGLMSRYFIGFSLLRNSSGAIGWYFIIYGISCGEYFESVPY